MRAIVGFLMKPSSEDERQHIIEHLGRLGLKYGKFQRTKWLYTEFLVKFPSVVSYMTAPAQFYHEVEAYIRKRKRVREMMSAATTQNLWGLEIYTQTHIYFHKPLENFADFDLTEHKAPELLKQFAKKKTK